MAEKNARTMYAGRLTDAGLSKVIIILCKKDSPFTENFTWTLCAVNTSQNIKNTYIVVSLNSLIKSTQKQVFKLRESLAT